MALSDKITILHTELTQRQRTQHARALLQNVRHVVLETNSEIQIIADENDLETLDTEIKQAMLAAWNICKNAQTAFEDAPVKELLDWSP